MLKKVIQQGAEATIILNKDKHQSSIIKRRIKKSYRIAVLDERIRKHLIDQEISIGDFVLSGGELPSMIITEAVVRLIPGTLKKEEATQDESFTNPNLIEHPQYTRPEVFHGWKVPKVLLSGDHAKIKTWQKKNALKNTTIKRPDLLS